MPRHSSFWLSLALLAGLGYATLLHAGDEADLAAAGSGEGASSAWEEIAEESEEGSSAHKALLPLNARDYVGFILAAGALFIAAAGGIGGGGILVPLYTMVLQFTTKLAIPLSNATILGGAASSMALNADRRHPAADRPLVDWDIILMMEPLTIAGALVGSNLNRMLPGWLLSVLLIVLLLLTARRTLTKGLAMFRLETALAAANAAAAAADGQENGNAKEPPSPPKLKATRLSSTPPHSPVRQNDKKALPDLAPLPMPLPTDGERNDTVRISPLDQWRLPSVTDEGADISDGRSHRDLSAAVEASVRQLRHSMSIAFDGAYAIGAEDVVERQHMSPAVCASPMAARSFAAAWAAAADVDGSSRSLEHSLRASFAGNSGRYSADNSLRMASVGSRPSRAHSDKFPGARFFSAPGTPATPDERAALANGSAKSSSRKSYHGVSEASIESVPESMQMLASPLRMKEVDCSDDVKELLDAERNVQWWKVAVIGGVFGAEVIATALKEGLGFIPAMVECGDAAYWVLNCSMLLLTVAVSLVVRAYLIRTHDRKVATGYPFVEGDVLWDSEATTRYPPLCFMAGAFAGLFGIGGGIVKGPIMLEMGVRPQVAAATCATMILFTSTTATVSFLASGALRKDYGAVLAVVGLFANAAGAAGTEILVNRHGRHSLIVISIGAVVLISAALMLLQVSADMITGAAWRETVAGVCAG